MNLISRSIACLGPFMGPFQAIMQKKIVLSLKIFEITFTLLETTNLLTDPRVLGIFIDTKIFKHVRCCDTVIILKSHDLLLESQMKPWKDSVGKKRISLNLKKYYLDGGIKVTEEFGRSLHKWKTFSQKIEMNHCTSI